MAKKTKKKPVTKPQQHEFIEGDLVAAKVKGYPSWPGRVEGIDPANKRKRYLVRFFGTRDKADTFVELKPFEALTESEKACSKRGFKEALAECQKEYELAKKEKNKKSDSTGLRKRSERGAAKKLEVKLEDEPKQEDKNELEVKNELDKEVELEGESRTKEEAELDHKPELKEEAGSDEKSEVADEAESDEKAKLEEKSQKEVEARPNEQEKSKKKAKKEKKTKKDRKVEQAGGDDLEEKIETKKEQADSTFSSPKQIDSASTSSTSSSNQKHEPTELSISTSASLEKEKEKTIDNTNDVNGTKELSDDKEGQKHNEAENTNIDNIDTNVCLPDSSTPDDQCQLPMGSTKSDESSKDCSLNDLTSEQANADRGTQTSTDSIKIDIKKETKKELTLAKLKKKIEEKLKEKDKKKRERIEKKSFDKASKILPKFILIFNPLAESSSKLIDNFSDKKVAKQFITSVKNCEKYLDSLEKCLKLLASKYGKEQKEYNEFYRQIHGISEKLIYIRDSKLGGVSDEAFGLLKEIKKHKAIKKFINDEEVPIYHNNLIVERKENSKKRQKLAR